MCVRRVWWSAQTEAVLQFLLLQWRRVTVCLPSPHHDHQWDPSARLSRTPTLIIRYTQVDTVFSNVLFSRCYSQHKFSVASNVWHLSHRFKSVTCRRGCYFYTNKYLTVDQSWSTYTQNTGLQFQSQASSGLRFSQFCIKVFHLHILFLKKYFVSCLIEVTGKQLRENKKRTSGGTSNMNFSYLNLGISSHEQNYRNTELTFDVSSHIRLLIINLNVFSVQEKETGLAFPVHLEGTVDNTFSCSN